MGQLCIVTDLQAAVRVIVKLLFEWPDIVIAGFVTRIGFGEKAIAVEGILRPDAAGQLSLESGESKNAPRD